jgi:hypothetical protein
MFSKNKTYAVLLGVTAASTWSDRQTRWKSVRSNSKSSCLTDGIKKTQFPLDEPEIDR